MHTSRILIVVALLLLLAADPFALVAQPRPVGAGTKADLDRLSALFADLPSVAGKRHVTVITGVADDPTLSNGWIVEETPAKIRFLQDDGTVRDLKKPTPASKRRASVKVIEHLPDGKILLDGEADDSFEIAWEVRPTDYAAAPRLLLAKGPPPLEDGVIPPPALVALQWHLTNLAQHAHAAHQFGNEPLAAEIYAGMGKWLRDHDDKPTGDAKERLHQLVANCVVRGKRRSLLFDCHEGLAWGELKKRAEKLAALPDHSYRAELEEYARLFAVNASAEAPSLKKETLAQATARQKTLYWLERLRNVKTWWSHDVTPIRDDTGEEVGLFGFILMGEEEAQEDPIGELEKLGFEAVPLLIEHLDDPTPMRVGFSRGEGFYDHVSTLLRVADVCQRVFEKTTGRTLSEDHAFQAGKSKQAKASAAKWWKDYQSKGVERMLTEGTEAGDRDSSGFGFRLAVEFPQSAFTPIVRGARASKNEMTRASLVMSANRLKDAGVVPFLREELEGPFLASRLRAATALAPRDRAAALAVLLREWKGLRAKKVDRSEYRWAYKTIYTTAIPSGDLDAIRMLDSEMRLVDAEARVDLLWQLPPQKGNLALDRAVEDMLMNCLTDGEPVVHGSYQIEGKVVSWPSVADHAASWLQRRLGKKALFDMQAPLQVREQQRRELKNLVLQNRGQPPIAPPPGERLAPIEPEKVAALIRNLSDSPTLKARRDAVAAVETLGVAALPAVRAAIQSLPANHKDRVELEGLAFRLARIVTVAEFAADSLPAEEPLRRKLTDLVGKRIDEPAITALLTEISKGSAKEVGGCRLHLERLADDSGVHLVVALTPAAIASKNMRTTTCFGHHLVVDDKDVAEPFCRDFATDFSFGDGVNWSAFSAQLRTALAAPSHQSVQVFAFCRRTKHEP